MNFQVIVSFVIYLIIVFILTYYFNLFASKTEYTRSEFSNILPQLGNMIGKIYTNYSILGLTGMMLFSGMLGILIPAIITAGVINSCLLSVILYFISPRLAVYFEQTRVTISDSFTDNLQIIFARYYHYILVGFNSGYAARLIYNWAETGIISFYWLLINILVITFLSVLILRDDIFHNL